PGLHPQHVAVPLARRRRAFRIHQGFAQRRRHAWAVAGSGRRGAPGPGVRPGRLDQSRRRRALVELVQPAHGPDLPLRRGRPGAVQPLRHPAGFGRPDDRLARPQRIITNHDWDAVGGGESGYLFPRKGDPSIIFGAGSGGNITRYDLRAHVTMSISPAAIRPFGGTPTATGSYYPWNTAFA